MNPFDGAIIPVSAFAGDNGDAVEEVALALQRCSAQQLSFRELANVLVGQRLLLPTQAQLDASGVINGLEVEKESHLETPIFQSDQGWRALLVFSSVATAGSWSQQARLVPTTADDAAQTALEQECAALIIDFAGPHRIALAGSHLRSLAASRQAKEVWQDLEIVEVITQMARDHGLDVHLDRPAASDVCDALVVIGTPAIEAGDLMSRIESLASELESVPILRERLDAGLGFVQG